MIDRIFREKVVVQLCSFAHITVSENIIECRKRVRLHLYGENLGT